MLILWFGLLQSPWTHSPYQHLQLLAVLVSKEPEVISQTSSTKACMENSHRTMEHSKLWNAWPWIPPAYMGPLYPWSITLGNKTECHGFACNLVARLPHGLWNCFYPTTIPLRFGYWVKKREGHFTFTYFKNHIIRGWTDSSIDKAFARKAWGPEFSPTSKATLARYGSSVIFKCWRSRNKQISVYQST